MRKESHTSTQIKQKRKNEKNALLFIFTGGLSSAAHGAHAMALLALPVGLSGVAVVQKADVGLGVGLQQRLHDGQPLARRLVRLAALVLAGCESGKREILLQQSVRLEIGHLVATQDGHRPRTQAQVVWVLEIFHRGDAAADDAAAAGGGGVRARERACVAADALDRGRALWEKNKQFFALTQHTTTQHNT